MLTIHVSVTYTWGSRTVEFKLYSTESNLNIISSRLCYSPDGSRRVELDHVPHQELRKTHPVAATSD